MTRKQISMSSQSRLEMGCASEFSHDSTYHLSSDPAPDITYRALNLRVSIQLSTAYGAYT